MCGVAWSGLGGGGGRGANCDQQVSHTDCLHFIISKYYEDPPIRLVYQSKNLNVPVDFKVL